MSESIEYLCREALKEAGIDDTDTVSNRSIRIVNKLFRENDSSNLWPIKNRFNATDRAIRKQRKMFQFSGPISIFEYILALEHEISNIVNSVKN